MQILDLVKGEGGRVEVKRSSPVERSARVLQLEGLFELAPTRESALSWTVDVPLHEREWSVGLIVGPSGAGKSTVARELFGERLIEGHSWPERAAVVDAFPARMGIKDMVALLASVGFSSPPAWLRPYGALSTGERFRVTVARALAESDGLVVVDEFTSVVDRTVGRVGSAAVEKAVRKSGRKFVAVTCHHDVEEWLRPDWVYRPHLEEFEWRRLRPRPKIELEVRRVHRSAWNLFRHHHYLDHDLANGAKCFVGFFEGEAAAFSAVLSFPHSKRPGWREHRTVCLPDFQGVGMGNALSEFVAALFVASGKPYRSSTSNPAMVSHRARSTKWKMLRGLTLQPKLRAGSTVKSLGKTLATRRLTASFEYVGVGLREEAEGFGLLPAKPMAKPMAKPGARARSHEPIRRAPHAG